MAVLDGHHDAGDPTDPVGSALGKIVRALPEPVAAQAEAVRRTTAPAPDRAAARPDPGTTSALVQAVLRPPPGAARLPLRGGLGVERRGRPVGGRRPARPVVPAVPVALAPTPARAYRIDRVRRRRGARRPGSPRRPTSTRSPMLEEHLAVGWEYDDRGRHRRAARRGRRAACPRTLGRLEPVDAATDPAGRQHQQPVVVRRAAGADPRAVPHRRLRRAPAGCPRGRRADARSQRAGPDVLSRGKLLSAGPRRRPRRRAEAGLKPRATHSHRLLRTWHLSLRHARPSVELSRPRPRRTRGGRW